MGDLLGHFKVTTAVKRNLALYRCNYWLMLFTHTVADKIKGQVNIHVPFSFLNVLCCPVLFIVGFQEATAGKDIFLFCST